jgi:hypothetical protein
LQSCSFLLLGSTAAHLALAGRSKRRTTRESPSNLANLAKCARDTLIQRDGERGSRRFGALVRRGLQSMQSRRALQLEYPALSE